MKSSIWYEKYKPDKVADVILPEKLKSKIQDYVNKEDIPNLAFMSADPGCLLPGTSITVEAEPVYITDNYAMTKYGLEYYDMMLLRYLTNTNQHKLIDDNLVTTKMLDILNLEYPIKELVMDIIEDDKKYKNKYLKFMYWFYKFNDVEKSIKKVQALRSYSYLFEDVIPENFKNFNPDNLKQTVLSIRFTLMYNDFEYISDLFKISDEVTSIDYWTFRGWSVVQACSIVSNILSKKRLELGGYFYCVKLYNDHTTYYHIGVTKDYIENNLNERAKREFKYDVIEFKWYDSVIDAKNFVRTVIENNAKYLITPRELFLSDSVFFSTDILK